MQVRIVPGIPAANAASPRARAVRLRAVALLLLAAALPAFAANAPDLPLPVASRWDFGDLTPTATLAGANDRMRLELAMVAGSRWSPEAILAAARGAAAILAQCGIATGPVRLQAFEAPARYRILATRDSREFAARAGLDRPAVFFVDDTRQDPAFDAEAIGRGNARSRPEMTDTVWITAAARDLPVVLAHELVHVLADSGAHSDAPDNLMRDETAPDRTRLTVAQCERVVAAGRANGLLVPVATR